MHVVTKCGIANSGPVRWAVTVQPSGVTMRWLFFPERYAPFTFTNARGVFAGFDADEMKKLERIGVTREHKCNALTVAEGSLVAELMAAMAAEDLAVVVRDKLGDDAALDAGPDYEQNDQHRDA